MIYWVVFKHGVYTDDIKEKIADTIGPNNILEHIVDDRVSFRVRVFSKDLLISLKSQIGDIAQVEREVYED